MDRRRSAAGLHSHRRRILGIRTQGIVPDLVTSGKPMANGLPTSMMAARHEVLEPFAGSIPYFNTFGGNPVCMAAAQAVLDVMRDEDTMGNARRSAQYSRMPSRRLCRHTPASATCVARACTSAAKSSSRAPRSRPAGSARYPRNLRDNHILTSVCGRYGNILKLRPPLVFSESDVDWFMDGFMKTLETLKL